MMRTILLGLATCVWLAGPPWQSVAQAPAPAQAAELQQKAEDVERLRQQLEQAQRELERLEVENRRLKAEQAAPPPARAGSPGAPARVSPPAPPLATLPPLAAGETVAASDLAGHFRQDPSGATARYAKRTFRVRGVVDRFDTKLLVRNYDVVLEVPDQAFTVVCQFNYVKEHRAVYTKERGRLLVARSGERGERLLLQVGQAVIITGKCGDAHDGQVVFRDCRVER